MKWKEVVRDLAIFWALTLLGGVVAGLVAGPGGASVDAIAVSTFIFSVVAFTISGCLTRIDRFKHLMILSAIAWLTSLVNVALGDVTLPSWFLSIIPLLLEAAVGGGMSLLFCQQTRYD